MMRRRDPRNIWFLLALPFIGAVGWAIGRFVGRRKIQEPVSALALVQNRPVVDMAETQEEKPTPNAPASAAPSGHALRNQPERLSTFLVLLVPFLILPVAIILLAFRHIPVQSQSLVPGGDPERGKAALQVWGCGSCHTIEGVTGADGKVGPALNKESDRSYVAGHLRNTPDNMIQWIAHPQEVSPGVDMPDSGVPESVARDMAAYLYSIR